MDDLPLLDQEDLDAITSVMTKLEAARFVAASKAQAEPQQFPNPLVETDVE